MIVATGGGGMLGRALARAGVHALARPHLDVTRRDDIARVLDAVQPSAVIHAAAYTAVERAEAEPERAFAINAGGTDAIARACAERRIALVYVSTDYVFDGSAREPLDEDALVQPRSVYGASKAAGERAVLEVGGVIVRTGWLFGPGGPSFVHAIARARDRVEVVRGQHGSPTWADDLSRALIAIAGLAVPPRILHYAGDPPASRIELARAVVARLQHPIEVVEVDRVDPIRPAFSALAMRRARELGLVPSNWQRGLDELAEELRCASS